MMKFKHSLSIFLFLSCSMLSAEPSAFDAGVIDSDNPYGLSESEKMLVENRKRSLSNQKLIRKQAILIERLQEKIEGLESVVDSLSSKLGQTGQKLNQLDSQSSEQSGDEIKNLQDQIDKMRDKNSEYYKKIDTSIKKLTKLISGQSIESKTTSHKRSEPKKKAKNTTPVSNAQLLQSAIEAYRSKNYKKAEDNFTKLATKNYMPAKTNFYLGEISYYTKKYDDAIAFYKTSVGYYDKASYMPKLLLHTALSFKNLGEGDSATQFFSTLIDSYPDSPEANIARKY